MAHPKILLCILHDVLLVNQAHPKMYTLLGPAGTERLDVEVECALGYFVVLCASLFAMTFTIKSVDLRTVDKFRYNVAR